MLTLRQEMILTFIRETLWTEQRPPTVREIQKHFGFGSPHAVTCHLKALEAKKMITRGKNEARGLFPVTNNHGLIPIFGQIPAGIPTEQLEEREGTVRVDLQSLGISPRVPTFALRVSGLSMIGAGILDKDIVVLQAREAREGEIVAALVDGQSTLKRYVLKKGKPYLQSENPDFKDIVPLEELSIQGVMVALIRKA